MLNIPAFLADKNATNGKAYTMLFELTYDDSDPANPIVIRFSKFNEPITFEGVQWDPFPIGGIEISQSTTGEIPATDIAIGNAGRLMMGIIEQYQIENKKGRLIWVHPDHLNDPTAKIEEPFTVISAKATERAATLTVAPVGFDPLNTELPRELVTLDVFPGVVGNRGEFLR